jgi:hypothetical protein
VALERIGGPAKNDRRARLAVENLPPLAWRVVDLLPGATPAPPAAVSLSLLADAGRPASRATATRVILQNARVRAEWRSGALASLNIDGSELVAAPSFTVSDYADQGGLWRMGNEMPGCTLSPLAAAGDAAVLELTEASALSARVGFRSSTGLSEARLDAGSAGLTLALTTAAPMNATRTVAFALTPVTGAVLTTAQPAGAVERPLERVYAPTFWPAVDWVSYGGTAILLRQSTGARMSAAGQLELMAVRDVRAEECDIEGGTGSDPGTHRIEWRIERAATTAAAARAALAFNRPLTVLPVAAASVAAPDLPAERSLASLDGEGVLTAAKPAERGEGIILRALLVPGPATLHLPPQLANRQLVRVDALERDLEALGAAGDTVVLDPARYGALATVRLR